MNPEQQRVNRRNVAILCGIFLAATVCPWAFNLLNDSQPSPTQAATVAFVEPSATPTPTITPAPEVSGLLPPPDSNFFYIERLGRIWACGILTDFYKTENDLNEKRVDNALDIPGKIGLDTPGSFFVINNRTGEEEEIPNIYDLRLNKLHRYDTVCFPYNLQPSQP